MITHHANEFVPKMAGEREITTNTIFFKFGVLSVNYPFLWNRNNLNRFIQAIREAVENYKEGRIKTISEEEKPRDHICKVCGNLVDGKCILEGDTKVCDT